MRWTTTVSGCRRRYCSAPPAPKVGRPESARPESRSPAEDTPLTRRRRSFEELVEAVEQADVDPATAEQAQPATPASEQIVQARRPTEINAQAPEANPAEPAPNSTTAPAGQVAKANFDPATLNTPASDPVANPLERSNRRNFAAIADAAADTASVAPAADSNRASPAPRSAEVNTEKRDTSSAPRSIADAPDSFAPAETSPESPLRFTPRKAADMIAGDPGAQSTNEDDPLAGRRTLSKQLAAAEEPAKIQPGSPAAEAKPTEAAAPKSVAIDDPSRKKFDPTAADSQVAKASFNVEQNLEQSGLRSRTPNRSAAAQAAFEAETDPVADFALPRRDQGDLDPAEPRRIEAGPVAGRESAEPETAITGGESVQDPTKRKSKFAARNLPDADVAPDLLVRASNARAAMRGLVRDETADRPRFDGARDDDLPIRTDGPLFLAVEDRPALFALRTPKARKKALEEFGGDDATERAVRAGLEWLRRYQHPHGKWSLNRFDQDRPRNQRSGGEGKVDSDTAATALALLPFLGANHTHLAGEYKDTVRRGLDWLIARQKSNGDLYTGGGHNGHMYSHGMAAIALCEAYGMTKDPRLREPAQRAIDFIVKAQHRGSGGWRYKPGQDGDTSVFGWQVMALKSGEIAGLNVPQETYRRARKWLQRVEGRGKQVGRYGYTNRGGSRPAMTSEGLLCHIYLGADKYDRGLLQGVAYCAKNPPGKNTSYYEYYATQVMFHMQGEWWANWNETMKRRLLKSQVTRGAAAGSWSPKDNWESQAGRLYATSLRLLQLEIYYRHQPLFKILGQ